MKYVMKDETTPCVAKVSEFVYAYLIIPFIYWIIIAFSNLDNVKDFIDLFAGFLSVIICSLPFAYPILKFQIMQKLQFTNKRVNGKTGLLRTLEMDTTLDKVQNISIRQGIFGNIFNFGTIIISTNTREFKYKYINHPQEFKELLLYCVDNYNEGTK